MARLLAPVTGLAAATGLALAGLGVTAAPAVAAACSGSTGVTVVIDTGTSVSTRCASGSPASALAALDSVAAVTQVQTQPGFVCRIDGFPASDPCTRTPPATAYWAFFHAERGGSWTYSAQGAAAYAPPSGSVIGFAFGSGSAPRSAPPAPASTTSAPASTPTTRPPTPTTRSTNRPAPTSGRTSSAATGSASPSTTTTSPTATSAPSPSASASSRATAAPTPSGSASPLDGVLASEPQGSPSGGLGTLVVAGALLVLVGGLAAWLARRRRSVE